jgi:hypothetical protein
MPLEPVVRAIMHVARRGVLFAMFALAFTLMGASWAALSIFNPAADASPYVYGLRLIAFLLIIAAVIVKNRERAR